MENNLKNNSSPKPLIIRGLGKLNKYILVSLFFIAWMLFFAEKDIKSLLTKKSKYADLQQSEQHLLKKIAESKNELSQLKTDVETIEKYAREKYLMKKNNEDLFILQQDLSTK
jgi:cell division protein DivIC